MTTALIALDWGTSSLRAFRLDAAGAVLEQRREPWGILALPPGGFVEAFATITEGWHEPGVRCIASGMVGSRNGWREAAYAALPFDLVAFEVELAQVEVPGLPPLHIVPGLADHSGPDVMRGEETETAGAFALLGRPPGALTVVLPGTHSKWVLIEDGLVRRFATALTGELFAVVMKHSILAQPAGTSAATNDADNDAAFAEGVARGAAHGTVASLFSARAAVLLGQRPAGLVRDYVSGLLIGDEIASMREWDAPAPRVLVGDPAITARYATALRLLDLPAPECVASAAAAGLFMAAAARGLLRL